MKKKQVYSNHVFFESSPQINNLAWFLLFSLIGNWVKVLAGGNTSLLGTMIFTIIIGSFFAYEIIHNKSRKVVIRSQQLVKQDGAIEHKIKMKDIKKLNIIKKESSSIFI